MLRTLAPEERTIPGKLRIVAGGRASIGFVARYRELYGKDLLAIFVGLPKWNQPVFDLSIVSNHSVETRNSPAAISCPATAQLVCIEGALARSVDRSTEPLDGPATTVVLIGGLNKAFVIDPTLIARQLQTLMATPEWENDPLTIVVSRRTSRSAEARIRRSFPDSTFVKRADRAGFEDAFACARRFVITPDSITMISEACATGKPVTIFDLPCYNAESETKRFIDEFVQKGYVTLGNDGAACPAGRRPTADNAVSAVRILHDKWINS